MSHTPGPWKVGKYLGSSNRMVHADRSPSPGIPITDHVYGDMTGNGDDNARLIAAAPDLLALVEEAGEANKNSLAWGAWICRARAVLARVNGEGA